MPLYRAGTVSVIKHSCIHGSIRPRRRPDALEHAGRRGEGPDVRRLAQVGLAAPGPRATIIILIIIAIIIIIIIIHNNDNGINNVMCNITNVPRSATHAARVRPTIRQRTRSFGVDRRDGSTRHR